MLISLTSIITLMICTSVAMAITICLCNDSVIGKVGIYPLLAIFLVMIARFFIPFEFPFAISLPLGGAYAYAVEFLRKEVPFYGFQIAIGNILLWIWLSGTLFFIGKLVRTNYVFARIKRVHVTQIDDNRIMSIFAEVRSEVGYSNKVGLYASPAIHMPFAAGLFRKSIFLPDVGLTGEELKHILRHELTHYKNGDLWIKLVVEGLVALYWWNPIVYVFRRQIDMALEMRVDYAVAKPLDGKERLSYFEAILKIARMNSDRTSFDQSRKFALMADGNNKSTLSRRVRMVCDASDKSLSYNTKRSKTMVALAVVAVFLSCGFVLEPYFIPHDMVDNSYVIDEKSSYIIVNDEGYYDIYIDNTHIATSKEIQDSFSDLRIYEHGKVED